MRRYRPTWRITADYLNRVNKHVVSSTLADPGWENTTMLRGEVIEEVNALKLAGRPISASA